MMVLVPFSRLPNGGKLLAANNSYMEYTELACFLPYAWTYEVWKTVRTELQLACPVFQDLQGQRYHEPLDFKDRSDPIWIPERLVRRVQETPRRQDEVSDADDAPVHPIAGTE
ncbi:hypothetical protein STEG23_031614 [Scotinomys teguina]